MAVLQSKAVGTNEAEQSCPVCMAELSRTARYCGGCGYAVAATATKPSDSENIDAAAIIGRDVGGRYRIINKLGEGGMGAVYRAEQISLKRKIALKVLKPELSASPELVRRFNAEAELAAKLNHPNTVTLYDFGQDEDGSLFIAMEFIAGRSLRDILIAEGPQSTARTAAIGTQICSSLSDAHATGIVHRDLKPDNVMLSDRGKKTDVVTVLDFGIAKLRNQEGNITQQPMTRAGEMLGTPQYMAPEQIRGDRVDARTDVYAMGIILYEMVTARLPFDAKTIMSLLSMHLTEPPIPPHRRRSDINVDPALEHLIMHCLCKAPDQRPPSMDVVEDSLAAIAAASGPISGYGAPPPRRADSEPSSIRSYSPAPAHAHAPTALPGSGQVFSGQPGTGQPGTPIPRSITPPGERHPPPSHASTPPRQIQRDFSSAKKSSRAGLWVLSGLVLLGLAGGGAYLAVAAADESEEEGFGGVPGLGNPNYEGTESADDFMNKWQEEESPNSGSGETIEDSLLAQSTPHTDETFRYRVDLPVGFELKEQVQGAALFSGHAHRVELTILTFAYEMPESSDYDEALDDLDESLDGFDLERLEAREVQHKGQAAVHGRLASSEEDISGDFVLLREGQVYYFAAIGCPSQGLEKTKSFRLKFLRDHFHPPGG